MKPVRLSDILTEFALFMLAVLAFVLVMHRPDILLGLAFALVVALLTLGLGSLVGQLVARFR